MLVFDPRYVDFPFAGLIGGLMPFVILALMPHRGPQPYQGITQGGEAGGRTPGPLTGVSDAVAGTESRVGEGGAGSIMAPAAISNLSASGVAGSLLDEVQGGGSAPIQTRAPSQPALENAKVGGPASIRPPAEKAAAAILALAAVFVILAEGFANWQALGFSLALGVLALTLLRRRVEPD